MELTVKEKQMRRFLIEIAAGIKPNVSRSKGHVEFLTDYDDFDRHFHLTEKQRLEALEHISTYDVQQNDGAPMVEMLLDNLSFQSYRPGIEQIWNDYETFDTVHPTGGSVYWRLIDDLSQVPPRRITHYALRDEFEKGAALEKKRAEWYWRVNRSIPTRLIQSLVKEHIVVNQQTLEQWTEEDIAAIAMRTIARGRYVNVQIRYLLLEDKPRFRYASYGDYFFLNEQLYVIVKRSDDLEPFHRWRMQEWLYEQAAKAPLAHTTDCVELARKAMERDDSLVVGALFAGTRTDLRDSRTNEPLYTGDVVSVKDKNHQHSSVTSGLNVLFDQPCYALVLDNCALPLEPNNSYLRYYKAGTSFFNLSPMMHTLDVQQCCLDARPDGIGFDKTAKELWKAQIKASPCYERDRWEWLALETLKK